MGSKEESGSAKPAKPATTTQELPTTPSFPDWPTPLPAYYGAGAAPSPAFYPPTVSSPNPHSYLWGSQHLMPPYGTPLPYPPIYPHGIYAHPSMAPAQGAAITQAETEGKPSDGKDRSSAKKAKGGSGNTGGKSGDGGKAASGSANDAASRSGESGSESSSGASEENANQHEFAANRKRSFNQMLADVDSSLANRGPVSLPLSIPGKPAVTMPATNLNIGMDLWNSSAPIRSRSNTVGTPSVVVPPPMAGREGAPPDMWINDEREIKRQRRKQSNRESARRSRLRKQAECEELAAKVDTLSNENRSLRDELQRLAEECEKLTSENSSIRDQLSRLYGQEAVSCGEMNDTNSSVFQAAEGEGNSQTQESQRGSNSASSQKSGSFFSPNGKLEAASN